MRRYIVIVVVIILGVIGYLSLTDGDNTQQQPSTKAVSTSGATTPTEGSLVPGAEISPTPGSEAPGHVHTERPETGAGTGIEEPLDSVPAVWDEASAQAAIRAAEEAVEAYTATELQIDEWWEGLSGHLTPNAQSIYSVTGRTYVPSLEITGPGTVVDQRSPLLTTVELPTAGGPYMVLLTREGGSSPWLVEEFPAETL